MIRGPLFTVGDRVLVCRKHHGTVIRVWPRRIRNLYDVELDGRLRQVGLGFWESDLKLLEDI